MQSAIGNLATQRLISSGEIQTKLMATSHPRDRLEKEADRVAETVVRGDRTCDCGDCESCRQSGEEPIQRKVRGSPHGDPRATSHITSSLGSGRRLDPVTQRFFESRMGSDFSDVRIHTDASSTGAAKSIQARAFTHGANVAFAEDQYAPHTDEGRLLLAHELAHVVQTRRGEPVPPVQRQFLEEPNDLASGAVAEVLGNYDAGIVQLGGGETVEVTASPRGGMVRVQLPTPFARAGEPFDIPVSLLSPRDVSGGRPASRAWVTAAPPPGMAEPSLPGHEGPIVYVVLNSDEPIGGSSAAGGLVPGAAWGIGRGIGFVDAPPLRGGIGQTWGKTFSTALQPSWMRTQGWNAPLGEMSGGGIRLERYVGDPRAPMRVDVLGELQPRFQGREGQMLAELEYLRRAKPGFTPPGFEMVAKWPDLYGLSHSQLGNDVRNLLIRASSEGLDALSEADRVLLLTVVEAHAQSGQVWASPVVSGSTRQGVSLVEGIPGTIADRPYVVQVEFPAHAAVADVNELLGERRIQSLIQESEHVFDPATGAEIRVVRVNPSSALGRVMKGLRHASPILEIGGGVYSGYRISTASERELPRVIGEEVGGHIGGYAGSAGGAAFCIVAGIASGGWLLLGCALVGGVAGGLGGSYVGGEIGESTRGARGVAKTLDRYYGPLIEKSIFGDEPRPGYYPPREYSEDPFEYEEEQRRFYNR